MLNDFSFGRRCDGERAPGRHGDGQVTLTKVAGVAENVTLTATAPMNVVAFFMAASVTTDEGSSATTADPSGVSKSQDIQLTIVPPPDMATAGPGAADRRRQQWRQWRRRQRRQQRRPRRRLRLHDEPAAPSPAAGWRQRSSCSCRRCAVVARETRSARLSPLQPRQSTLTHCGTFRRRLRSPRHGAPALRLADAGSPTPPRANSNVQSAIPQSDRAVSGICSW